jgi:selenocysteine lyase/cysteine desulfurase
VVADRVAELTRDVDTDCSFNNRRKFGKLREESRRKVAEQLGVTADEIALVRNTSEGNNIINSGLPLSSTDEVVIWDQNHPTNNVAWEVRAARYGISVKRVTTPKHPKSMDELFDVFSKAIGPKTRVLSITHLSNVSGIRLPVKEICEFAHQKSVYVHVDGAQTWGAFDVKLADLGCDSYAASAHKWFIGPKEAGVLYVRKDRISEIWPSVVAPGWGDDAETDLEGARKFESLGQRDDACLAAVGTTVDFYNAIGRERVEARILELATALKHGLKETGASLVTPLDPNLSGGVCIIDAPRDKRRDINNRLYEQYGIAGAPTGGLRLCPHIYNTMEHIERAVEAVRELRPMFT